MICFMINIVANYILEIVFCLFIVSILINFLFGIDVVEKIMKIYNKIAYNKNQKDSNEDE